jgi:hypothetical protein
VAAHKRLGKQASCPFCGRRGRIVRVVSIDEWRRRTRHSFDEANEGLRDTKRRGRVAR